MQQNEVGRWEGGSRWKVTWSATSIRWRTLPPLARSLRQGGANRHYTAMRTLRTWPGCPELPDEGVHLLPDCNRLVARVTLLKRLFVLRRGPHIQALAEIGVGIDVVQLVVALLGDKRSPRCQSAQIG